MHKEEGRSKEKNWERFRLDGAGEAWPGYRVQYKFDVFPFCLLWRHRKE